MKQETREVTQETLDRRQETGTRKVSKVVKKIMVENCLKNMAQWHNFFMARICFPTMCRAGAKIKCRGGANAMALKF